MAGVQDAAVGWLPVEGAHPLLAGEAEEGIVDRSLIGAVLGGEELEMGEQRGGRGGGRLPACRLPLVRRVARLAEDVEGDALAHRVLDERAAGGEVAAAVEVEH